MKLTSFSIASKPSSKVVKSSAFLDEPTEKAEEGPQYVTEYDRSAPLIRETNSITIPRQENTWRPERKMKNINLHGADLQFEVEIDEDPETDMGYGLNLRNTVNGGDQQEESAPLSAAPEKSIVENLWDQKYREDMANLADEDGPDKYRDVPVENFAAAVLASYGWSEGKGIGRNAKGDVPIYEHPKKMGGFGAMVDPEIRRQMRRRRTVENGVGGRDDSGDRTNAAGQVRGNSVEEVRVKRGEAEKQNRDESEARSRDRENKDEQRKRKDSYSGYEDKRDSNRDDKRADRTYGGCEDKRDMSRDDKRADKTHGGYEDKRDASRDDKRTEKSLHEGGGKDYVSCIDWKEKRDRSRDDERASGGRQEDSRRDNHLRVGYEERRDRRTSERGGDRGQHEERRKRSADRSNHVESRTDPGRRGDEKLLSRRKDETTHGKKEEDAKRVKGIMRKDIVDERISEARAVSWLTSHIRVRVISKEFRGGKFYLKKGEVVDVTGPRKCIVSVDGSNEIIEVNQEILETALPKRGGPVIVLYGKHKGVFGKLVQRDTEQETGMVQDAETFEMITVALDQIAEYVGDPSYIGS